jgi:hypothetical protein
MYNFFNARFLSATVHLIVQAIQIPSGYHSGPLSLS